MLEQVDHRHARPAHEWLDPTDETGIERAFVERPCKDVELLANHLTRPDAFAKMLMLGRLTASTELARAIDPGFTRTHRGYYLKSREEARGEPQKHHHFNAHISFNIGKPQAYYASSYGIRALPNHGGLGVTFSAKGLLADPNTQIAWGQLETWAATRIVGGTPLMEPAFLPFFEKTKVQLNSEKEELQPPKDNFLNRVHLSRKAGLLTGMDQAEVQLHGEAGAAPEIPLTEMVILVPERMEEALIRLLRLKLREIEPWKDAIEARYGIDLTSATPEGILAGFPNIYWYPQRTIEHAVEFLSVEPTFRRTIQDRP